MTKKFHFRQDGFSSMDLDELYKTLNLIKKDIEDTEIDDSDAAVFKFTLDKCREYIVYESKHGDKPASDYKGYLESLISVEQDILSSSKWFLDFLYPGTK